MTKQLWKKFMIGLGVSSLLLAGCNNNEQGSEETDKPEENVQEEAQDQPQENPLEQQNAQILKDAGSLEEVQDIPEEEKQAILDAFNEYIDTFNEEDVEGYLNTLSDTPVNFTLEEEEQAVNNIFQKLDVTREASNVKIINYQGKKADVYAELDVVTKDPESDRQAETSGKQLTIMQKTDEGWKVSMITVMEDKPEDSEE